MKFSQLISVTILLCFVAVVHCVEKEAASVASSSTNSNSATSGTRQAASTALTASGILSTLTSFFKSTSLTSFLPGLLLFGLGAMLVPAFGLGVLLREGRRSDYNVQPNNLAFSNPLFAKNLPPIYSKEFESLRGMPYIKTAQPQFAPQARSMQSYDFNNLFVDVLGKIQKSLDSIHADTNKKNVAANSRLPTEQQNLH